MFNSMFNSGFGIPSLVKTYLRFSGVVREGCVLIGGRVMTQLLYTTPELISGTSDVYLPVSGSLVAYRLPYGAG